MAITNIINQNSSTPLELDAAAGFTISSLSNSSSANVLYYNSGTGAVTHAVAPGGGGIAVGDSPTTTGSWINNGTAWSFTGSTFTVTESGAIGITSSGGNISIGANFGGGQLNLEGGFGGSYLRLQGTTAFLDAGLELKIGTVAAQGISIGRSGITTDFLAQNVTFNGAGKTFLNGGGVSYNGTQWLMNTLPNVASVGAAPAIRLPAGHSYLVRNDATKEVFYMN